MSSLQAEVKCRRTFAIISHPDAGKTTVTEKLLLLGNAIKLAGTVKAKKSNRKAKSDWMKMEQERGISVTTSVMQFLYKGYTVNLLDTPGHEDFSEDTYRTLTAVDSAVMIIDAAKGVEPRTRKLLEICRMRDTPIITFINKLDRESLEPLELIEQIEDELDIHCVPRTWPIGSGRGFRGTYDIEKDEVSVFERGFGAELHEYPTISNLESQTNKEWFSDEYGAFVEEVELVREAGHDYNTNAFLKGEQTPVFFGTALQNFGVDHLLEEFVRIAPEPQPRQTHESTVQPGDDKFSGFVFKIQANMDPKHRDRIAFMRICSGSYSKGMRMRHVRMDRDVRISDAVTFMAGERSTAETAYAGDIIGLHNHGTIRIGDSFSIGNPISFLGVPNFAPELFKRVEIQDPLKSKKLALGIKQLSEEGATQVFFPMNGNQIIVGAIGSLQFDLVTFRLAEEYGAECHYVSSNIYTVRWVSSSDEEALSEFKRKAVSQLAWDGDDQLTLLATSRANLQLMEERWPTIEFQASREHAVHANS